MTDTLAQAPPNRPSGNPPTGRDGARPTGRARRPNRPNARPKPRRQWPHRMIPVVLILLGALVVAYPVGATFYNNYRQHEVASDYSSKVSEVDSHDLADELARAEQYNATLPKGLIHDPWKPADEAQQTAYKAYLGELDSMGAMARIRLPSIRVELPIYHGTSDDTLARGVGHLFGSTLPIGGPGTHAVLTGHSSLATATMFDHLPDVRVGDTFYIDVLGRTLAYQVDQIKTVLPDQLGDLERVDGMDYITLVTCTPYAVNTHRLLVRGHQVPYVKAVDPGPSDTALGFDWTIQSWMWPRLIGAGAALLLLLAMIGGWIRSDRRRRSRLRRPPEGRESP